MNLRWKESPSLRQMLFGGLVVAGVFLCYQILRLAQGSGLDLFARANSTRTAIALTSNALLGPFPTATGPTPTPSKTPTITPTPSITPTPTPTQTPFHYYIDTATPRTLVPGFQTSTIPTGTFIPPTNPPRQPTNPPQATNPPPQATNPPQPTKQPKPTKSTKPTKVPKSTKTPKR